MYVKHKIKWEGLEILYEDKNNLSSVLGNHKKIVGIKNKLTT